MSQPSNSLQPVAAIGGSEIERRGFGSQELQRGGETQAGAVAARESAMVQARYIIAERNPRDIEKFRVSIKSECKRPGFAAVARYAKPQGGHMENGKWEQDYVYGPTIRFVEAALRTFRNVSPEVFTVYDSPGLRIVRVSVTDLESNITYANEIQIGKTVERKGKKSRDGKMQPPEGREVLGERTNSYGDPVFIVVATEDEVLTKQNALVSKSIRTQALRLLPGDIVEECMVDVVATLESEDKADPAKAMRVLIDAFHELHVEPDDLVAWAGKPLDRLQPKEIQALRMAYVALRDGESTWEDIMSPRVTGSKEEQDRVRNEKLAALNNLSKPKQDTTPTTDNGSVQTADQIATVSTGGQTDARQSSGTNSEIPPTPGPGRPQHHIDLATWRDTLGNDEFMKVMGRQQFGYELIHDVPLEDFATLQAALGARAMELQELKKLKEKDDAAAATKPNGNPPLRFGKRP